MNFFCYTGHGSKVSVSLLKSTEGGGCVGSGDQAYMCPPPPQVIGKIKKILPWLVIGKNKKNLEILPLKEVKFEIFARVVG